MNERIQELKREAEALAYEEHKANCIKNGRDPSMPHANALNMTFEKFAELIMRECIDVIGEENYTMLTGKAYCTKLKRHFGVK